MQSPAKDALPTRPPPPPRLLRRDPEELHRRPLLDRRAHRPFALEEDERSGLGVVEEGAAVPLGGGCDVLLGPDDPPRARVRQPLEPGLDAVLVLEAVEEDVELELADGADDGFGP